MASLTWLHLSDLHAGRPRWDSGRVTEALVEDLRRLQRKEGLRPDLLFFTGDAAFGRAPGEPPEALDAQLDAAAAFLTAVRRAFVPEVPLSHVFLVPGNHDVDRTEVLPSQTAALDRLIDEPGGLDQVHRWIADANREWKTAMARLSAWRRFLKRHGFHHLLGDPERLIAGCRREVAGVAVGIAGFNSAWSCCRNGEDGKLWLGGGYQHGVLREAVRGADFAIALVHHPPSWLAAPEKDFGRRLQEDAGAGFRFLLHGHEHRDWVQRLDDGRFVTLAAAACYERSNLQNGYNLVRLDLERGRGEVWLRQFVDPGGWVKRPLPRWAEDGVWELELPWLARGGAQGTPVPSAVDAGAAGRAPAPARRGAPTEPAAGAERIHEKTGMALVYVPGGEYELGAEDLGDACRPVHRVVLGPFWIGKHPVTNEQYARYMAANPMARQPESWTDEKFKAPQQPVVGVSWEEADLFCEWAGLALPSEAQWEAAARGTDRRTYPWGNKSPTPERANYDKRHGRTTPAGSYPLGAGPFGTLDQAGNVWEWCEDVWDPEAYGRRGDKSVNPVSTQGDTAVRSLRGGSLISVAGDLPAAWRYRDGAAYRFGFIGFRCVLLPRPEP